MAKKRPKYEKTKAVKAIARTRVGSPPPGRVLNEKVIRSRPKHKKDWSQEDESEL
jgi:hypothetical protein